MWALYDTEAKPYSWYKFSNIFNSNELDIVERLKSNQRNKLNDGVILNPDDGSQLSDNNVRRSKVSFIDIDESTDWLYRKLTDLINSINNSNYNFILDGLMPLQYGVYESTNEGFYDWHIDGSLQDNRYKQLRKLSFSILMSEKKSFEGGDLIFKFDVSNPKIEKVELDQYDVVFFPSFYPHKVTPVTKGVRESIVGWVAGPAWR